VSTLDGGQSVGRYRIERFLGAGAMGEVYLAQDPHIERSLAIKTVRLVGRPQEIDDRKKRLLREAKAAGRLLHPNIVTLFDTGEADDVLYLAFEYVEGMDLSARVTSGSLPPLSLREVLRIIAECAEALDYAHRQGIVHRDIKPSNILLDKAGHVKVADFGIAKMVGQSTELTVAGSVMGSPQYLSPEQIRGEELDGRSDVFSLGVVLFELLSGRRPFDGETITTLVYQILHKEPPRVSELRGGIPPRLEALLAHMLAKDRDERLATAGLVAEEIKAIERELPDDTLAAPASTHIQQQIPTYVLPRRTTAAAQMPASVLSTPPGPAPATAGAAGVAAPTASSVLAGPPGLPVAQPPGSGPQAPPPPPTSPPVPAPAGSRSRTGLWIGLAVGLVVFLGLVAVAGTLAWRYYQKFRSGISGANPADTVAAQNPSGTEATPGTSSTSTSPATPGTGSSAPVPSSTAPGTPGATPGQPAPAAKPPEVPVVVGTPIEIRNQPPGGPGGQPRPTAGGSPTAPIPPKPSANEPPPFVPAEPTHRAPAPVSPPGGRQPQAEPAPAEPAEPSPRERPSESGAAMRTGMNLAFRVTPPDAFILVDGTVIGRADEWSGLKGAKPYTLADSGEHTIKIRKPGMKDYKLSVDASETSGTTPINAHLQPLPTREVSTSDLQSYHVKRAIGFKGAPAGAEVLVDGNPRGAAKGFACGVFGRGGLELSGGTHRVTVSAPGYAQRDLKVEVDDEGGNSCESVDLNMARGGGG
jgi:serine/threonine protein kinase